MTPEFLARDETAQRNWTHALNTYRTALAVYRRMLDTHPPRRAVPAVAAQLAGDRPAAPSIRTRIVAEPARIAGLTSREREVAELIALGYSNQQIAETLVLARGTVANHVAHILGKLGVANRTQVAAQVLDRATHAA